MSREYHVSVDGSDLHEGSASAPFKTISKAASLARPGDTVTVHAGTYREEVDPKYSGVSDIERIVYRAAPGEERPVIKGSEHINSWQQVEGNVWKVELENSFFGSFNPYKEVIFGDWLNTPDVNHDKPKHLGDVYLNGRSFYEVTEYDDLFNPQERHNITDNALQITVPILDTDQTRYVWYCQVDDERRITTIWANFQGADPNKEYVEINVRRSCFFPSRLQVNYITVRGFEMAQAACPWTPPTAPQVGMVGPHWSRGWIIEDNVLHDAKCSAVCLGKEESTGENEWYRTERKTGYQYQLEAVFKGLRMGWTKGVVGSHIVRRNEIFDCGQNAIVGHMGCAFSRISYNHVYRIGIKREFFGWEVAGIKFHAAIDTVIDHNDVHDCSLGLWLDWQAQGTRVSSNVMHHNVRDVMIEVTHGPCLLDNNVFASACTFQQFAQGSALVHNVIAGTIDLHPVLDRSTPYHYPHTTEVAGCAFVQGGDDRYYNNIFTQPVGLLGHPGKSALQAYAGYPSDMPGYIQSIHDEIAAGVQGGGDPRPVQALYASGNAYCGVPVAEQEIEASAQVDQAVRVAVEETEQGARVTLTIPEVLTRAQVPMITTATLGTPRIVEGLYENPDGSPITFDTDIVGQERTSVVPGPVASLKAGETSFTLPRK